MRLLTATVCSLVLLCGAVTAQTPEAQDWIGGEFGMLLQKTQQPVFAYSLTKTFTLDKIPVLSNLLGTFAQGWEGSVLYADRAVGEPDEIYAGRIFNFKVFAYKGFFTGLGVGAWTFANTDGADVVKAATKGGIGYAKGGFIFRAAGDIVSLEGDDLYFVHLGIVFNL